MVKHHKNMKFSPQNLFSRGIKGEAERHYNREQEPDLNPKSSIPQLS